MSHHLQRRCAQAQTRISRLARWFSGPRTTARPHHRLTLERCESRIAPATATLSNGVLTIDYAGNGAVTVSVSPNGSTISAAGSTFNASDVNRIEVFDSGNGSSRSLSFLYVPGSVTPTINLSGGLSVKDVEDIAVGIKINATGNASIDMTANRQISVHGARAGDGLAADAGDITLQANLQPTPNTGLFDGIKISSAEVISNFGAVNLHGRGGIGGASNRGVNFWGVSRAYGGGSVSITGIGGAKGEGIYIAGGTSTHPCISSPGLITLFGNGGPTVGSGICFWDVFKLGASVVATGIGSVILQGTGGSNSPAIYIIRGNIITDGGPISLNGIAGGILQYDGVIRCGTLLVNTPNQIASFGSSANKASQLVIPANTTAIVNGSFDSNGFVQVDGTLGGIGSVGVTTVSSTGRVKPGIGGSGVLTTGNIAFNAGSVFDVQLNRSSNGQLAVNGTVNLGGATLQATIPFASSNVPYRIIDDLGTDAVTGTFALYGEGSTYATGSTQFRVGYEGGTGNDVTLTPPAVVSSVVFGDGTDQRSLVKQLIVNFSQPANFTATAFTLSRTGSAGATGSVGLVLNPPTGPTNSVTITFAGPLTEFGSLVDGFYDLTLDATKITNSGGSLDGDANGTFGGNYAIVGTTANKFFRLFGDANGNGAVGLSDVSALHSAFNRPSTVFDLDGDGFVGLNDFARFRKQYGLSP